MKNSNDSVLPISTEEMLRRQKLKDGLNLIIVLDIVNYEKLTVILENELNLFIYLSN